MSDPAQTVTPLEALPCPFCGQPAVVEDRGEDTEHLMASCDDGGCIAGFGWIEVETWNKRVEQKSAPLLPSPSEREELIDIINQTVPLVSASLSEPTGTARESGQTLDARFVTHAADIARDILRAGYFKRSSPSSSEAASDDTRRLNLVADLLDDVRFAHDQYGESVGVALVWNAGDGGGDVETTGKDWREAIDKMLLRLYGDAPKTASPSSAGQEVPATLAADITTVVEAFNARMFVRNTDGDGASDWAVRLLAPLAALSRLDDYALRAAKVSAGETETRT